MRGKDKDIDDDDVPYSAGSDWTFDTWKCNLNMFGHLGAEENVGQNRTDVLRGFFLKRRLQIFDSGLKRFGYCGLGR